MTPNVKHLRHEMKTEVHIIKPSAQLTSPLALQIKRSLDVIGAAAGLVFFMPLLFVLGVLVKLDSRGPVFFSQKRLGKDGRAFKMFKLRTMVVNAEELKHNLSNEVDGPMFKVSRDPRVTRVGRVLRKWSLDEVPQIFNVLTGDMSLVGPRPLADMEMRRNPQWRAVRLSVKPGLTGLWQIKGRGSRKFSDWVKYDMKYVSEFSLWLDLKILLLTVGAVLGRKGAE